MVNAFERAHRVEACAGIVGRVQLLLEELDAWTVDLGGVVDADRCTCSADTARRWARAAAGARASAGLRRIGEPTGSTRGPSGDRPRTGTVRRDGAGESRHFGGA